MALIKVDIFSGFLGAGKTTLLKKMIEESFKGQKIVLIENEFGEIGIDGAFLQEAGVQINEMNSGCICCSLVGDFQEALKKVIAEYSPDRILIEPSGVGKLSDVMNAVNSVSEEVPVVINSTIAVADVRKVVMYMKNFGEFYNDQIKNAKCIILSRTGEATEAKIALATAMIKGKNSKANLITTPWEQLDASQILSAMEIDDALAKEIQELKTQHMEHHHGEGCCGKHGHHDHHEHAHGEKCCGKHGHEQHQEHDHHEHAHHEGCCGKHGHDHANGCGNHGKHAHGHLHADDVFATWGTQAASKTTKEQLEKALTALDSGEFGAILRAKGILDCGDSWYEFDFVPDEINLRPRSADVTGKIVVIGADIDKAKIAKLFGCEE